MSYHDTTDKKTTSIVATFSVNEPLSSFFISFLMEVSSFLIDLNVQSLAPIFQRYTCIFVKGYCWTSCQHRVCGYDPLVWLWPGEQQHYCWPPCQVHHRHSRYLFFPWKLQTDTPLTTKTLYTHLWGFFGLYCFKLLFLWDGIICS